MFDPETRDRKQQKGSLLAHEDLREDQGGQDAAAASTPAADVAWRATAADRHRIARSRREAVKSPLMAALSQEPEADTGQHGASPYAPAHHERDGHSAESERQRDELMSSPDAQDAEFEARWHQVAAEEANVAQMPEPPVEHRPAPVRRQPSRQRAEEDDNAYWQPLIDPMKVVGGIMKSRWLIVATTICGAALAAAIAISTPKEYSAVAELLVDPREIRITDRDFSSGGLASDATLAIVENQVRVLTSGSVMNKVVDKLGLDKDPEFNGEREGGIGNVFATLRSLISIGGGGTSEGIDRRRALAVENLYRAVDVERGGKTFVISIRATTESPQKSALIANTLTEVFLQAYGSIQSDSAGRASEEITARLAELQRGVDEAERKVETFKAENDIVDAQGRLISDDEILKLNDQLATARARTMELTARATSTRNITVESILTGNLPEQMNSQVITDMRSQYALLRQEADRLATRLGPRHPERMAIDAQVEGARRRIDQELKLVASSVQVELKRAVQLEQDLASRLAQLKARQANLSGELVTMRELEREANARRAVYEAFLLRARETGEQKDINTANMSVISPATPPLEASSMSRSSMTILGAMLGFAAGVAIGAGRGVVDSVRDNAPRGGAPYGGGSRHGPAAPARARAPERDRRRDEDQDARADVASATEDFETHLTHHHPAGGMAETAEEATMYRNQTQQAWQNTQAQDEHNVRPLFPNQAVHGQQWDDGRAAMTQPAYAPEEHHTAPWYGHGSAPEPQAVAPYPSHYGPAPQGAYPYQPMPQAMQHGHAPAYAPMGYQQPHHGQPMHPAQPAPMAYYPQAMQPQPVQYWAHAQTPQPPYQPVAAAPQPVHYGQPPAPRSNQENQRAAYGAQAYGQPYFPPAAPLAPAPAQPSAVQETRAAEADRTAIDEIRDSLREFREALRELAESRTKRRFL